MNVLDVFSGIGGFALGLERAGMHVVAFCESDAYCRRVLAKHWPSVRCYPDIRQLTARHLVADGIAVDIVCGGFPCQDISVAGSGAGLDGKNSGLWTEFARILGELRPRFALIENTAVLTSRGLSRILCDLAALRYDAEWHCIPACAVGAPHIRDRIWIIATNADRWRCESERLPQHAEQSRAPRHQPERCSAPGWRDREDVGIAGRARLALRPGALAEWAHAAAAGTGWWSAEPDVGRVAHGVPERVDRLRALGNAVVPQIPEAIGRAILAAAASE